jgi:sugar phosphate permease
VGDVLRRGRRSGCTRDPTNGTVDFHRGSASGIYLACYFLGGIVRSVVLGQLFDRAGWTACVAGIGAALAAAVLLAARLTLASRPGQVSHHTD